MNLIEAIKSGRPWRRASWDRDSRWRMPPANPKEAYTERWDDLIADDWEIQEPTVTITRTQFWKAYQDALENRYGQATFQNRLPPDEGRFVQFMAKRLGLGE